MTLRFFRLDERGDPLAPCFIAWGLKAYCDAVRHYQAITITLTYG
jgi:hypothetical protein